MNKDRFDTVFVVLFVVGLFLPIMNWNGWILKNERSTENRKFHDRVDWENTNINELPAAIERVVNDNFSFRSYFLKGHNKLRQLVFGVSGNQEKVIVGQHGWHFLAEEEQESYLGIHSFSQADYARIKQDWSNRADYCKKNGIALYWMICPVKQSVYSDELPKSMQRHHGQTTGEQLKTALHGIPNLQLISPLPLLLEKSKVSRMYYQLDNHWNDEAGYSVSQWLIDRFQKDLPSLKVMDLTRPVWKEQLKLDGILKAYLGRTDLNERTKRVAKFEHHAKHLPSYGFKCPEAFPYPWQYEQRYGKSSDSKGPRILIFRDSYGDALIPFLRESFAESVFIFDNWEYAFHPEIVKKVKPDIVLYVTFEAHLNNLLK